MDDASRIAKLEAQVDAIKEDVSELKNDVRDLHSRITTGNREIMDKIDQKFESLTSSETVAHTEMKYSVDRLSNRVDTLEKWRYMKIFSYFQMIYIWLAIQKQLKNLRAYLKITTLTTCL